MKVPRPHGEKNTKPRYELLGKLDDVFLIEGSPDLTGLEEAKLQSFVM